jgi:two-component system sensor histidine kinase KdpD
MAGRTDGDGTFVREDVRAMNSSGSTWRRERRREVAIEPTVRHPFGAIRVRRAYVAAIVAPLAIAAALIPLRDELDQSTALILVVPVAIVALTGGIGPGLLSAASATLSFDVFLTRPYYGFAIHDNDDVVAAVTLLVVGVLIGATGSRLARVGTRALARRRTLDNLMAFVQTVAEGDITDDALVNHAGANISMILGAAGCEWRPDGGASSAPTILPNGQLMGFSMDLGEDRAQLPSPTELPVVDADRAYGRFVLLPTVGQDVSLEERRTAAAIAALLAHALSEREFRDGGS